eukprot:1686163-Rhodomonas_salina.1
MHRSVCISRKGQTQQNLERTFITFRCYRTTPQSRNKVTPLPPQTLPRRDIKIEKGLETNKHAVRGGPNPGRMQHNATLPIRKRRCSGLSNHGTLYRFCQHRRGKGTVLKKTKKLKN